MAFTDGYGDGVNDVFFPGIVALGSLQEQAESAQHIPQQTNGGYEDSAQINRLIKLRILNDNGHPVGCGCEYCGGAV